MKILAIGDFHGKICPNIKKVLEKKEYDTILCAGDFTGMAKIRDIIFKSWKEEKAPWYEIIGIKKAKRLLKEDFNLGVDILKYLNSLRKKVFLVFGNSDYYRSWVFPKKKKGKLTYGYLEPLGCFNDVIKKLPNLNLIQKEKRKINNLIIGGHGEYLDVTIFVATNVLNETKEEHKIRLKRYKRRKKEVFDLFKGKKPDIFLIHYPPYKVLDIVKYKNSPLYKKHAGFEPYTQVIKEYKPFLVICGHMHEYQGIKKIGKSIMVNPGLAEKGRFAVIDVDSNKKKVKSVKFFR
ncbi:hypothetical protein COS75_03430 [Candidatus Pacearchaeota archaeon CG06_land_8_20_14_3_00_35_12]|nr:MAG: hypothetical protein COS75_03430 [Candidatus Pacearchaeota archaeon CG06_land_8_20_14_3_00_35_12]